MMGEDLVQLASHSLSGLSYATLSVDPPTPLLDPKMGPLSPILGHPFQTKQWRRSRAHSQTSHQSACHRVWEAADLQVECHLSLRPQCQGTTDAERWLVWLSSDA